MCPNTALKPRRAVVSLTPVHICTQVLGRVVIGACSTARGYRLHVDTWYDSLQLILPGFEIFFPYSNLLGRELIQSGLTAAKSFAKRAIDSLVSRLPRDWRTARMEQTFYTIPPAPPLIEHFLVVKPCGKTVIYEFMDANEWYNTKWPAEQLWGHYFTMTYHCSFCWCAVDFSQQEAYDLVKKFYHPHEV
jgi:hypothetical protein